MIDSDYRVSDPNPVTGGIGAQSYATQLGSYDEMYAAEQKVLPFWERFITALETLGHEELERRRREVQRLLRENGVTYNVYGDSAQLTRPWQLDPVPLLISSEQWQLIEAGLKQRAELLDLILQDIYGAQTLLKKGLLPVELILGHPGFLHPCVGALQNQRRHLTIYSANFARGPDGRMWILDDRTQAPSGFGYALENRSAVARVSTDIFRATQVRRLSGFFKMFGQSLAAIAGQNKDNPRIVVLTPGPFNETYFEHAYLASYLGFTLVQGDDLTVRDGRVWLKSLKGLQPVDVILRRLDDTFCDPLSFRSDSRLGVAGLLEAVLQATDSLSIYLRRYRATIQLPMVLKLLLTDTTHPRSVVYQLGQLSAHIAAFPREHGERRLHEEERLILKAHTDLRLCDVLALLQVRDEGGVYNELDDLLSGTAQVLGRMAEVIAEAYFSHSQSAQLLQANTVHEDEL
ncbi:MAG: hypothetical protein CVV13_14335 [Gammaproteobacteria bacterium HGW-Gammaproteobacteria-3]|nr:MAG: hypothetical protein CVV13_14335 [Gammaproteobacteria bacterium HGW-Gammaproteobacteria-3]